MFIWISLILIVIVLLLKYSEQNKKSYLIDDPDYKKSQVRQLVEKVYLQFLETNNLEMIETSKKIYESELKKDKKQEKKSLEYYKLLEAEKKVLEKTRRDLVNAKSLFWSEIDLDENSLDEIENDIYDDFSYMSQIAKGAMFPMKPNQESQMD